MLIAPAILLFAQIAAGSPAQASYDGICEYPDELRERTSGGGLLACNKVEIAPGQVSFGNRSWETRTRFNGTFEGDRMTVTSLTTASGREWPAQGVCELSRANGKLSNVACSAYARNVAVLANFRVSTINDAR